MLAICKREFKAYFDSFIGWLFLAATIAMLDLYFVIYNLYSGYPYTSYVMQSVVMFFIITIPILTMRILAEERRNKTDQLILTAPVKISGVVLGKFFALAGIFTITVLVACLFPLIMSFFGTIPYAECYVAVLGFALYGYACIAVGIFVSSLTESQVIAAVVSFVALFLGYIMAGLCQMISESGNIITTILKVYDFMTPYSELMQGTLNLRSVVYFLSLTAVFLFLTVQSIQKRRYSASVKNIAPGAYSVSMIAVTIAVAVAVNLFATQIPERFVSIDVSGTKMFTITDDTKNLLSGLQEDVTIYVLDNEGSDTRVDNTLSRYADYPHVHVEYVDPSLNPRFATKYTNEAMTVGSVIVVSGERSKAILQEDLYEYTVDYSTYQSEITAYDAEGQLTSAIAYVTGDYVPKLYALTGHGETKLATNFSAAVEKNNIELETLNLMQADAVPEDCEAILINGPTSDINAQDTQKLMDYIHKGGNLYVVTTFRESDTPNFDSLLAEYGMAVEDSLVFDSDIDHYAQYENFLLPDIRTNDITERAKGNGYIFAPYASPITDNDADGVSVTELLFTSDSAYTLAVDGEEVTDMEGGKKNALAEGSFTIGLKAVKTVDGGESTLLLYSCLNLMNDNADAMVSGNNQRLFSDGLVTLVDRGTSVSIPAKAYSLSTLLVDQRSFVIIAFCSVIVLPIALLVTGFVIWFKRRRK